MIGSANLEIGVTAPQQARDGITIPTISQITSAATAAVLNVNTFKAVKFLDYFSQKKEINSK